MTPPTMTMEEVQTLSRLTTNALSSARHAEDMMDTALRAAKKAREDAEAVDVATRAILARTK